jgi:hypothetical protein
MKEEKTYTVESVKKDYTELSLNQLVSLIRNRRKSKSFNNFVLYNGGDLFKYQIIDDDYYIFLEIGSTPIIKKRIESNFFGFNKREVEETVYQLSENTLFFCMELEVYFKFTTYREALVEFEKINREQILNNLK